MSHQPKNHRSRRSSVKWRYCGNDGSASPELGWFYEVKRGSRNIRILPADVDHFNCLLKRAGMQPVGPDWTDKVPLNRVTDRTEIPKTRLPSVAAATDLLPLSSQNLLVKLTVEKIDWPTEHLAQLTTAQKLLWKVVTGVYPARKSYLDGQVWE